MRLRLLHALAALALIALCGYGVFAWSRRVEPEAARRYGDELRNLLALQARLTSEVLKARSGIVGHYDAIVQTEASLKRVHERLRPPPRFLSAQGRARVLRQLDASEALCTEAERLIERFKREHSVLRNSLRYLPVLARELDAESVPERAALGHRLGVLLRDELLLQSWQDHALLARIQQGIAELERAAQAEGGAGTPALSAALTHARAVLQRTPVVNDLVRAIVALPVPEHTRELMSAYTLHHQRAVEAADADRAALLVLATLAVALVAASIIASMRRSAARLRATSAELEQAVASLRVEQEKQKELGELKSRFVAMTSHEFRTPLSVIVSSSEMLEVYGESWPKPKQAQHFERIRAASLGMTRMLEAILMISRSDAGVLKFEPRELELGELCRRVLDSVGQLTRQPERIVYSGPDNGAFRVVADETLLKHILENLLSNALKYSPAPRAVELAVARRDGELVFTVRDEGIGIADDDRARLFETFHRGRNVGAVSGSGLGLAIVKRAVDLHGGSVVLDTELGRGTRFTVRIPCPHAQS